MTLKVENSPLVWKKRALGSSADNEGFGGLELKELCGVREDVIRASKQDDDAVHHLTRSWTHRLSRFIKRYDPAADVIVSGSTNPSRSTFVLEPNGKRMPFPPDIDIAVVLQNEEHLEAVNEYLSSELNGAHSTTNQRREKQLYVKREGDFNLTVAVYSSEVAEREPALQHLSQLKTIYHDRIEVRTLKLLLQRNGCYGNYNRGISGIACEELIRQYSNVERVFGVLQSMAKGDGKKELPFSLNKDENLLRNISRYVWDRVDAMVELYRRERVVKASAYSAAEWYAQHKGSIDFSQEVQCSLGSCGREPGDVANGVRARLETILQAATVKRTHIDFYVVPCQGNPVLNIQPYTHVFACAGLTEKINSEKARKVFDWAMRDYSNHTY